MQAAIEALIATAEPEKAAEITEVRRQADELAALFDTLSKMREPVNRRLLSLAKTNLEQAVQWAVMGIMED